LAGEPLSVRPRSTPVVVWWWLRKNMRSAAWVVGLGVAFGIVTGLPGFVGHVLNRHGVIAFGYRNFPGVNPPWPFSHTPRWPEDLAQSWQFPLGILALLIVIVPFQLALGLLIALCVRPRDRWADISAGGLTTLVAALTAFFIITGPITTWSYEEAVVRRDVDLLTNGFAIREDSDPIWRQEEVLRRYPDLRAVDEKERAKALESKIVADLFAGSFRGIWQGLLASLVLVPAGICQTLVAGHLLRRPARSWRILHILIPYLEVAVVALLWSSNIGIFPSNPHPGPDMRWRGALLLLLSTAWLALGLIGVFRGWRWWRRWLLHLAFAAASVGILWVIFHMHFTVDVSDL